jgi:hypothetical protein
MMKVLARTGKQNGLTLITLPLSAANRRFTSSLCTLPDQRAGTYIDKKCPFTGNVSIRGRILAGVVKSTKMNRTIIVRRNYFHYIKKYQRCVRLPLGSRTPAAHLLAINIHTVPLGQVTSFCKV